MREQWKEKILSDKLWQIFYKSTLVSVQGSKIRMQIKKGAKNGFDKNFIACFQHGEGIAYLHAATDGICAWNPM